MTPDELHQMLSREHEKLSDLYAGCSAQAQRCGGPPQQGKALAAAARHVRAAASALRCALVEVADGG